MAVGSVITGAVIADAGLTVNRHRHRNGDTMDNTIDWPGQSGKAYRYWLGQMEAGFLSVGGNYAFVRQLPNGNFLPLYFGESSDLSQRLPNHEVWPDAVRMGATHVMTHTTPSGAQARLAEERDLIARWNPPLNLQHRTTG